MLRYQSVTPAYPMRLTTVVAPSLNGAGTEWVRSGYGVGTEWVGSWG